jgi:hypothetical protein
MQKKKKECVRWGRCVGLSSASCRFKKPTSILLGKAISSGTKKSKGKVCDLASNICDLVLFASSFEIGRILTLLNSVILSLSLSNDAISPLKITRIWFVLVGLVGKTETVPIFEWIVNI